MGCKEDTALVYQQVTTQAEQCADCPKITITLPNILKNNNMANVINTALELEVIGLLDYGDGEQPKDMQQAIASFLSGYANLRDRFPEESTPWEATIKGEVVYENDQLASLAINAYIFTGGAHGYNTQRLLNFDKGKVIQLENWQLFNNESDFTQFAESKFRTQEKIPVDMPINHTGFMFEEGNFYLPENIGFTNEGLKLLYNQYEIASFADDSIELVLPYNQIAQFLALGQNESPDKLAK